MTRRNAVHRKAIKQLLQPAPGDSKIHCCPIETFIIYFLAYRDMTEV